MSIYIQGKITVPKPGSHLIVVIYPDGEVYGHYTNTRQGKAIDVPGHGRLADIDELIELDKMAYQEVIDSMEDGTETMAEAIRTHYEVQKTLNSAETVIPEDREEPKGGT